MPLLLLLLQDAGYRFAFEPVRCKFTPTQATLQLCEESGVDLAQDIRRAVKRKERIAAVKLSGTGGGSGGAPGGSWGIWSTILMAILLPHTLARTRFLSLQPRTWPLGRRWPWGAWWARCAC